MVEKDIFIFNIFIVFINISTGIYLITVLNVDLDVMVTLRDGLSFPNMLTTVYGFEPLSFGCRHRYHGAVQQLYGFQGAGLPPGHVRQLHQELLLLKLCAGLPGNGQDKWIHFFLLTH